MLRAEIEETIKSSVSAADAAVAVCRLLEDSIGLEGNGWFDDDPELRRLLGCAARDSD